MRRNQTTKPRLSRYDGEGVAAARAAGGPALAGAGSGACRPFAVPLRIEGPAPRSEARAGIKRKSAGEDKNTLSRPQIFDCNLCHSPARFSGRTGVTIRPLRANPHLEIAGRRGRRGRAKRGGISRSGSAVGAFSRLADRGGPGPTTGRTPGGAAGLDGRSSRCGWGDGRTYKFWPLV